MILSEALQKISAELNTDASLSESAAESASITVP